MLRGLEKLVGGLERGVEDGCVVCEEGGEGFEGG